MKHVSVEPQVSSQKKIKILGVYCEAIRHHSSRPDHNTCSAKMTCLKAWSLHHCVYEVPVLTNRTQAALTTVAVTDWLRSDAYLWKAVNQTIKNCLLSWRLNFNYSVPEIILLDLIQSQLNPIQNLTPYFSRISTDVVLRLSLELPSFSSLQFLGPKHCSPHISSLSHTCYMSFPSHPPSFITLILC